jgi:mono/diheme cytochrome c family protein
MNRVAAAAIFLLACLCLPCMTFADPGLLAQYSDGRTTVHTSTLTPAFALKENESVHPQIAAKFTAKYEGAIKILRRATYTFNVDGGSLTLDGKAVTTPVELEPGEHAIAITYERKGGAARLEPMWASDQFTAEPIPASVLSHSSTKGAEQQALVERGQTLVEELNCAGCHKSAQQRLSSRVGPDLSNVGARVSAAWIFKWLENPQHFRAGAVMPALLTKVEDRRDVAAYLATLKDGRRKVNDYNPSKSKAAQGKQLFEAIGCANCHQDQAALEGLGSKWASLGQLAAYLRDPLTVDRSGRMPAMQLSDEEAVALANHLMGSKTVEFEAALPAGADAGRGKQTFRSAGCLACHTVEGEAGKASPDAKKFAGLEKLDASKGCLAAEPPDGAARYAFGADARGAMAAFLTAIKTAPLVAAAPAHEFLRTLQKLNCGACHETDQSKPASEDVEKLPPLTAVGAKLKKDWINQVLHDKRARVRFWLKTRMPEFGGAIDHVAEQAIAAAGVDDAAEPSVTPTTAMTLEGQKLVGANDPKKNPSGMGCVTCHSLREFKPAVAADATRGPELTLMATRLRSDFFHRWMHEPARIQPGTAMPNFFTDKPRDQADRTIDTLWAYASLGQSMPAPVGVKEKHNYTLIVTDTPIVSRCQVPDPAGTIVYGISVGLPGRINYTFDAEHVMFRTAWRGGFLDMSGDWDGRGGNPVRILGQRFYSQAIAPLRIGDADKDSPRVFKGYELKEKIPTFIYTVGGVEVRERITALENGVGIVRTFELDPGNKTVYFEATDQAEATISIANGQPKAMPVQKSFNSTDKVAGQVVEFPPAGRLTIAVTIRAK